MIQKVEEVVRSRITDITVIQNAIIRGIEAAIIENPEFCEHEGAVLSEVNEDMIDDMLDEYFQEWTEYSLMDKSPAG